MDTTTATATATATPRRSMRTTRSRYATDPRYRNGSHEDNDNEAVATDRGNDGKDDDRYPVVLIPSPTKRLVAGTNRQTASKDEEEETTTTGRKKKKQTMAMKETKGETLLSPSPREILAFTTASRSVDMRTRTTTERDEGKRPPSVLVFVLLLLCSVAVLYYLYSAFPALTEEELQQLNMPATVWDTYAWFRNLDNVLKAGRILSGYIDQHYNHILATYLSTYLFMQAFAIPGSTSLSFLGGGLFGFWHGLILVAFCSAIGASFCYLLSKAFLYAFVQRKFGSSARFKAIQSQIQRQRSDLFFYVLFLRITPFVPNWFINITSPHLDVPLRHFALATFFGVMPLSYIPVQAGITLPKIAATADNFTIDLSTYLGIIGIGVVSLLPVLASKLFGARFRQEDLKKQ